MEHPFFTTAATTRTEALRWLTIAEKLLAAYDLLGSKSFAARAHDSDPTLSQADEILVIVDTLLAGERRFANNQPDWYAVLRLTPLQGRDAGLVSDQYRRLGFLLNPQTNKFPFAEQAFRLVFDAYSILSNPSRRSLYDKELAFYSQPPPPPPPSQQKSNPFSAPMPALSQNFIFFGGGSGGVGQKVVHGVQSGGIGGSHSAQVQQVHVPPQVEPVVGGSTRQPQNFMGFSSGYNIVFGSGSSSKSGYEDVSNQERESYSTFGVGGNVVSASETTPDLFNNMHKQSLQNCSNVSDETIHNVNVNVSENVGEKFETMEDKEDVEVAAEEEDEDGDGDGDGDGDDDDDDDDDDDGEEEEEEERADTPVVGDGSAFWTACPYCYYMYEYPQVYVDCTLKCQNCKRAFQAVVIPSPPPIVEGQESYFCCWGFLPFGFSMEDWKKYNVGALGWAPFTPLFSCSQMGNNVNEGVGGARGSAPRVNVDNNEVYVVISDSSESDEDWQDVRDKYEKNNAKNVKGKKAIGTPGRRANKARVDKCKAANIQDGVVSPQGMELPKKPTSELRKMGLAANAGKQPGCATKNFGKLDLNVELSIETEEPAMRTNQGNGSGRGEDDNIEGNGFFEGLDEYLSSLPILNVVGDDKVVKAAS